MMQVTRDYVKTLRAAKNAWEAALEAAKFSGNQDDIKLCSRHIEALSTEEIAEAHKALEDAKKQLTAEIQKQADVVSRVKRSQPGMNARRTAGDNLERAKDNMEQAERNLRNLRGTLPQEMETAYVKDEARKEALKQEQAIYNKHPFGPRTEEMRKATRDYVTALLEAKDAWEAARNAAQNQADIKLCSGHIEALSTDHINRTHTNQAQ
jgi:hypothetical protein